MKVKIFLSIFFIFNIILNCNSTLLIAQEQEDEELLYSWGSVQEITSSKLVTLEYDYENEQEVEIEYNIESDLELNYVDSIEEINVGDSVEVEYEEIDDKKIARIISVELSNEEEETVE